MPPCKLTTLCDGTVNLTRTWLPRALTSSTLFPWWAITLTTPSEHLLGRPTASRLTGLYSPLLTLPATIRGRLIRNLHFLWCTALTSIERRSILWFDMCYMLDAGDPLMWRVKPRLSLPTKWLRTRCEAIHPLLCLKKGELPPANDTSTAGLLTVTGPRGLGPLTL